MSVFVLSSLQALILIIPHSTAVLPYLVGLLLLLLFYIRFLSYCFSSSYSGGLNSLLLVSFFYSFFPASIFVAVLPLDSRIYKFYSVALYSNFSHIQLYIRITCDLPAAL